MQKWTIRAARIAVASLYALGATARAERHIETAPNGQTIFACSVQCVAGLGAHPCSDAVRRSLQWRAPAADAFQAQLAYLESLMTAGTQVTIDANPGGEPAHDLRLTRTSGRGIHYDIETTWVQCESR